MSAGAAELAWAADRLTLATLDAEHRAWFESLAEWIAGEDRDELWNEDSAADDLCDEIAKVLGVPTNELSVAAVADKFAEARAEARAEGEKDATIPSRANTSQRKAMRLLIEARLTVQRVETDGALKGLIVASCRGDSATYQLGFDPRNSTYRCTCPELKGDCSHLAALKLVTSR